MWKLAFAAIVLLAVAFAALMADRPQPRADFTMINPGDVKTLDIHHMSWLQDMRASALVFERLIEHDVFSHDFAPRPAAAESWTISGDGRTYTFRLRHSARWSNGASVTSQDFRRTFRRALLPDTAADYTEFFQLIDGGAAFSAWRTAALAAFPAERAAGRQTARGLFDETLARFDQLVGLHAPDDHTLIIRLERRTPYFLDLCGFEMLAPLFMDEVERFQTIDEATGRVIPENGWTRPGRLVGNGAFMLTSWRFKRDMRFERNPHYWNTAAIPLDSIAIESVNDPNAVMLAFGSGSVDWVSTVVAEYKREMLARKREFLSEHQALVSELRAEGLDPVAIDRRLPKDPRANIHAFPAFGTAFLNFNCAPALADGRPNPFGDPRVRRAFTLAADRARIADLRGCGERPAGALIPPGSIAGYVPPVGLGRDVELARRLLAEAGFPAARGFPVVELLLTRDSGHEPGAQSLARDWREVLGVECALIVKEKGVFSDDVKRHRFMISTASWFGDYGDPTTFLDINRTGHGSNDRLFSSPAYDDLLRRAGEAPDELLRMDLLAQAERLLVEDECPLLPLVHYVNVVLFDPHRLSGISPHPRQQQLLFLAEILGDGKGPERPLQMPPPPGMRRGY
ncbi:MAG: peptide ABC transporter substrate-binding protein [Phycisphaerales bacterium]